MSYTVTETLNVTFEIEECCNCHVLFGMPGELYNRRKRDHASFYCPNGHSQHYTAKSEAEKLKEQLEAARDETARVRQEYGAEIAAHQKLKRRIARGVCPHCTRTFQNIARHMEKKHGEAVKK